MPDIIFFQAPSDYERRKLSPPLGIAYLVAAVKEHGYGALAVDLSLRSGRRLQEKVSEIVQKEKPKVIGVSATTETFSNAIRIIRACKKVDPHIKTILGGVHPTFATEECLSFTEVDVVVLGEGEKTIVELADHFLNQRGKLEAIRGIAFLCEEKVMKTEVRPLIANLDEIPFPMREDFSLGEYRVPFSVVSSRGCPGRCIFCVSRVLNKGKYRERSVENILSELQTLPFEKYDPFVAFQDSTLTANRRRTIELCHGLMEKVPGIRWGCESRVDTLDETILQLMKDSGCAGIEFGVEAGSEQVLKLIRKDITMEQVLKTVELTSKVGIKPICTIMLGHHCDTEETLRESVNLAIRLKKEYQSDVFFNIVTPYPGTPFLELKDEYGIQIFADSYDDYSPNNAIMSTRYLSAQQIRETYVNAMLELSQIG